MRIKGLVLRFLLCCCCFLSVFQSLAEKLAVPWQGHHYSPHFADINGDGVSDLLLQSRSSFYFSYWIFGVVDAHGVVRHYQQDAVLIHQVLHDKAVVLADVNGDGFSDLVSAHEVVLSGGSGFGESVAFGQAIASQGDELLSGDFNGDGLADVLVLSSTGGEHSLYHGAVGDDDADVTLQWVDVLKGAAWAKEGERGLSERLGVFDMDGDGRDDIFVQGLKANQPHFVIYADESGLLLPANTKRIGAKIGGRDWHQKRYVLQHARQGLVLSGSQGQVSTRLNNAIGGIDEHGQVAQIGLESQHLSVQWPTQAVSNSAYPSDIPATPTIYPDVIGGSYQPYNQPYTVTVSPVLSATYYQLYEALDGDDNYQLIYQGSGRDIEGVQGDRYGYRYYRYRACNSVGCSGLSPYRRIVVYTTPTLTGPLQLNPVGVTVGQGYRVSFLPAGGAVDGTVYTLYENGTAIYAVTRQSWTESSYQSDEIIRMVGGDYDYQLQACNPGTGCSGFITAVQQVVEVASPPSVLSTPISSVLVNQSYQYQLVVQSDGAVSFALSQAPVGMSISNEGLLTWQPSEVGDVNVSITISEGEFSVEHAFVLSVLPVGTLVWADIKSLEQGDFTLRWGLQGGAAPANDQVFELRESFNGQWQTVWRVSGVDEYLFRDKVAGQYRYQVFNCHSGDSCDEGKMTAPFTVSYLPDSPIIDDAVDLSGLDNDVGFTTGQFDVSESGAATYTVPIDLPEGIAKLKPQVALHYDSQAGVGMMGRGWNLQAVQSISRCQPTLFHHQQIGPINYDDGDKFCYQGQFLRLTEGSYGGDGSVYHTDIDQGVSIKAHGQATMHGPQYFTLTNKAGETWYFGDSADSFVEPSQLLLGQAAKLWMVSKIVDAAGGVIAFSYAKNHATGELLLQRIEYGGHQHNASARHFVSVDFNYRDNPHPVTGFAHGAAIANTQLLDNIDIKVDNQAYRLYQLSYDESNLPEVGNYLSRITQCIDASRCLAPLKLTWQRGDFTQGTVVDEVFCEPDTYPNDCVTYPRELAEDFVPFNDNQTLNQDSAGWYASQLIDINGDGLGDVVFREADLQGQLGQWQVRLGPDMATSMVFSQHPYEYSLAIDINGDGATEMLLADSQGDWHVAKWADSGGISPFPLSLNRAAVTPNRTMVGDVNGDGLLDLVFVAQNRLVFYANTSDIGPSFAPQAQLLDLSALSDAADASFVISAIGLIDINGDGRSDVLMHVTEPDGYCELYPQVTDSHACEKDYASLWVDTSEYFYQLLITTGSYDVPYYQLGERIDSLGSHLRGVDLNADGLTDLIYGAAGYWRYRLADGQGFLAPKATAMVFDSQIETKPVWLDLNDDGRSDMLYPSIESGQSIWRVMLSRALADDERVIWENRGSMVRPYQTAILLGDINGDGRQDMLSANSDSGWRVGFGRYKDRILDVVSEFTTGNTGSEVTTQVAYGRLNDQDMQARHITGGIMTTPLEADSFYPTGPMTVVKQVRSDIYEDSSGSKAALTVDYRYGGLQLHRQGLNGLGFAILQTEDWQSGVISNSYYHQDYPFIGLPKRTEQYTAQGLLLSESTNVYAQTSAFGGRYVYLQQSTQTEYHVANDPLASHQQTTTTVSDFSVDAWGNTTQVSVDVQDSQGNSLLHTLTEHQYGNHDYDRQFARLSHTNVTKTLNNDASTSISRHSDFSYYLEGEGCAIAGSSAGVQIRGLLKSTTINGKTTDYCYNAYGQIVSTSVSALLNAGDFTPTALISHQEYSDDGRVVVTSRDVGGNLSRFYYNHQPHGIFTGVLTAQQTVDANGLYVNRYFDKWGALVAEQSSRAPTRYIHKSDCQSSDCPAGAITRVAQHQAGQPSTAEYFDPWGRTVATSGEHFSGGWRYQLTEYDHLGRLYRQYHANLSTDKPTQYQQQHYDHYGRLVEVVFANGGRQKYMHTSERDAQGQVLLLTIASDPRGRQTKHYRNLLGQLVKVVDALGVVLDYQYNAFGQLLRVNQTGANNSITRVMHQYDTYGSKIETLDSQIGRLLYQYNGFGQLTQHTNANNDTTRKIYDAQGRLIQQYSVDANQCWYYSQQAPTIGALTRVQFGDYLPANGGCGNDINHSIDYQYDALGRLITERETINHVSPQLDDSYTQARRYDAYGRHQLTQYAGTGTVIRQGYNAQGFVTSLIDHHHGKVYQQLTGQNAHGQTTSISYGNGSHESFAYDPQTHLVTEQYLTASNVSHQLDYGYYLDGQLSSRSISFGALSAHSASAESFSYDGLNRLVYRGVSLNPQGTMPDGFNINQSYPFDDFGNMISQSTVGLYQYDTQGRLVTVQGYTKANQPQFAQASYDLNGNLLDDGVRSFQYTSYNQVHTISKVGENNQLDSVQFVYGINQQRYARLQQVAGQTTNRIYLAGGQIEKLIQGEHIQYRTTVGHIVLTDSNGDTTHSEAYYHKDRQGSVISVTNQHGQGIEQFAYGPWGSVHQLYSNSDLLINNLSASQRQYTSQESVSDFGIIHMNGRIYDPQLGRFLQADPFIQAIANSQSYNRYAYVLNDPMNRTDPSGFISLKSIYRKTLKATGMDAIYRFLLKQPMLNTIVTMAVAVNLGPWAAAAFVGQQQFVATGSLGQGLKASVIHLLTAQAHNTVGKAFEVGTMENILGNAIAGGIAAQVNGGKFGHGFIAAGISAAFKPMLNDIGGDNSANHAINEGNIGKLEIHKLDRIFAAALISGTTSAISGGKFANGALSGALTQLYNGESTNRYTAEQKGLIIEYVLKTAHTATKNVDNSSAVADFIAQREMPESLYLMVRGALIHREFSRLLNEAKIPGLQGERFSYFLRYVRPWSHLGSSRPDATWGDIREPLLAFELKTGKSGMSSFEKLRYDINLPEVTELVVIQAIYLQK